MIQSSALKRLGCLTAAGMGSQKLDWQSLDTSRSSRDHSAWCPSWVCPWLSWLFRECQAFSQTSTNNSQFWNVNNAVRRLDDRRSSGHPMGCEYRSECLHRADGCSGFLYPASPWPWLPHWPKCESSSAQLLVLTL